MIEGGDRFEAIVQNESLNKATFHTRHLDVDVRNVLELELADCTKLDKSIDRKKKFGSSVLSAIG